MIGNRLQQIMDYYHLTPISFSERLQIQRSSLSHFFTGRNKPGWDFLEKLARTFPEINIQWFLTGAGNMLNSKDSNSSTLYPQLDEFEDNSKEFFMEKEKTSGLKGNQLNSATIEKIIIFYNNGTCKIYQPE